MVILQGVGQELVHLGDAGRDAEVDGSVTNLDDEATDNVRVDLEEGRLLVCWDEIVEG